MNTESPLPCKAPSAPGTKSFSVLTARLMWFMLGPGMLLLLLAKIITDQRGWWSKLDAAYGATIILMALGRWFEQRSGSATDTEGNPTTMKDCQRYVTRLIMFTTPAWLLASVLGNNLLQ